VLFALNQSLVRLEELRNGRPSPFSGTEDLVRHYNCRNLTYASFTNPDMLSDSGNASDELLSKNINQYFRQELIEKRNARMAHRVLQLLRQYPDESFFFAFGTGHFLGNGSVLDYVRDGGYEVEQVSPDAKIRNLHNPVNFPRYFPINSRVSNSLQRREEISETE
ncbi:metalloprotease TIKI2, partial [Trichonephila clavata]